MTGVNTLFNALINNPDFAALDFSQLPKHLRAARIGLAARDQPIDDGGLDLVGPGLEQPRADI